MGFNRYLFLKPCILLNVSSANDMWDGVSKDLELENIDDHSKNSWN